MAASLAGGGSNLIYSPPYASFTILWSCVKGLMVMLDSVEMAASLAGGGGNLIYPSPF